MTIDDLLFAIGWIILILSIGSTLALLVSQKDMSTSAIRSWARINMLASLLAFVAFILSLLIESVSQ
jgi:uncharacterized membrane protein YbhN (UPF0104 family)